MVQNIDLFRICLIVSSICIFIDFGVEAQAQCLEPRCVDTLNADGRSKCGVACSDPCTDVASCADAVVNGDSCEGFDSVCTTAAYHLLLLQIDDPGVLEQPCECDVQDLLCFSSEATADVENKGKTLVKDIEVGDKVLTGGKEYKPVYTIDHKDSNKWVDFVQIHSTGNVESPLELTASHMVFMHGKENPIPASAVKVGDALHTVGSPSIVTKISHIERKGLWNPITADGTIVVDGIVTSTYNIPFRANDEAIIEVDGVKLMSHHDFLHLLMTPYRAMCLGLSLSFCETKHERNGYSKLGTQILQYFYKQSESTQDSMIFVALQIAFLLKLVSFALSPLVITGAVLGAGTYYYVFVSEKKKLH